MRKDANLVELEKCCQTDIFLQNFVLIQPRTSPPKICKIFEKCIFEKGGEKCCADRGSSARLSARRGSRVALPREDADGRRAGAAAAALRGRDGGSCAVQLKTRMNYI